MELANDIAVVIDRRRIDLGLTVQELASDTQIPLTTLQRRLAGDGKLTVAELRRLADRLQTSPSAILEAA